MSGYTRPLSIAKRVTESGAAHEAQTALCAYEIVALGGDVLVDFKDGVSGEILWSAEADASAGSKSESFDRPILFPNGVYIDVVDGEGFLHSVSVALDLPQSSA